MHWKRILFIVDTPDGVSRPLVKKIAGLARGLAAEIEVFDAVFDPSFADCEQVQGTIERRQAELEAIVRVLREESVHAHATVRWAYPPREGIFQQIHLYQPDLLVIQSRRHARLARILFTYSDYKLIETAPCAVLIIKNDRSYAEGRVIAAVDPALTHDKPAALDERIVQVGAGVAEALQLPLHVFHACHADAESHVSRLATMSKAPTERVHVEVGNAVALLPHFVAGGVGDLLVMGAVSRSRIRKALIGHTAEKVLEETGCDVLIVRPDTVSS